MLYEILKFELIYRIKRPETYLFCIFLFAMSIFGVDFILQGVELGLVKKNAPIVVGKTMGAMTGIFMILTSMIMGMPIIRDDQYHITPLFYTQPITKYELLMGRFTGSFLVLIIIFCAIPLGMMVGELLPWHLPSEMLPFNPITYLNSFLCIILPTLFFGSALFFVTGTLSRKLLVVYTQGIFLFVIFLLTKAVTNEYLQAILDPFSLTTITQLSKTWSIAEKNSNFLQFSGILLANKIFWVATGVLALLYGYAKFNFSRTLTNQKSVKSLRISEPPRDHYIILPEVSSSFSWNTQFRQFVSLSSFYTKTLLKETSFWAIIICALIIILINSVNLGTIYGVDSYPATYLIIEELQEMSMYFFIIILLFYSGELYWKEKSIGISLIIDSTAVSSFVQLSSKVASLILIYLVLILCLIVMGIAFQVSKGYYYLDLHVYFTGFFIEILPFLALYTCVAFFMQSLINNKFAGILLTLIFTIATVVLDPLGFYHVLLNFGGRGLTSYSEMNGHGHFLAPYLWSKLYWFLFCILLLIVASTFAVRGTETSLSKRIKAGKSRVSKKLILVTVATSLLFLVVGSFVFFQSNILNRNWSENKEQAYRANYEKTLKTLEYLPQPNLVAATLDIELFPSKRGYEVNGQYILKNETDSPISEIHIQKLIDDDITLDSIAFSAATVSDSKYDKFYYYIYQLQNPLKSGDSLSMNFKQILTSKGFNTAKSRDAVLYNGTFIRSNEFPTLGYNRKYELKSNLDRAIFGLDSTVIKAALDNKQELKNARSGDDSKGIRTSITIGTDQDQTAITSGMLVDQWQHGNRNYFKYVSRESIINFYSILSGKYEIAEDRWNPAYKRNHSPVDLEIYFHPRHKYNIDRMMNGMKASLEYYSLYFSPYQYKQLRIVEFPRYESFAQSFPNTIPFSESMGFMLDIEDSIDIDMPFFITAHEVAHQWWGMQVEAANVTGKNFILETLSQYSALMVFKTKFPHSKVDKFLELQEELYLAGRNRATEPEVPLYLTQNEEYIYYNKGALVMYKIQEIIGEENVNLALQSFIQDWNSKDGRIKKNTDEYATAEDLVAYILEMTPFDKRNEVAALLEE